jgi:hypothetical protein
MPSKEEGAFALRTRNKTDNTNSHRSTKQINCRRYEGRRIFSHNMLHTLLKFCYLLDVSTTAYRTPLRSTASSKTKIFESDFGEALRSVLLPLLPTLLPIAGQVFVVTLLTQSSKKDITAVNVESKSDLKAVLGELKAVQVEWKSEIKAVQEASIHGT